MRTRQRRAQLDGLGDRNRSLSRGRPRLGHAAHDADPDPQRAQRRLFLRLGVGVCIGCCLADRSRRLVEHFSHRPGCRRGFGSGTSLRVGLRKLRIPKATTTIPWRDREALLNGLATRWRRAGLSRSSYADVTRRTSRSNSNDDLTEMLGGIGGIGGMQRIVSNLARREDIPDEWWAEAGLSRTLSREASTN